MAKKVNFWVVFWLILKISFIAFGGGNALMPIIKREVVDKKQWLDNEEFNQVVIVTNMLPGASVIQTISYIAIKKLGRIKGSLVTLLGILPHILVAFGILLMFNKIPFEYVKIISVGVLVSIIAFLLDFGYRFLKQAKQGMKSPIWIIIFIFSLAFCLFIPSPYNTPVLAIICVILVYSIVYLIWKRKSK